MLKLVKHADSLPQVREIVKQVTVTESLLNGRTCTWKSTNKLLLARRREALQPLCHRDEDRIGRHHLLPDRIRRKGTDGGCSSS